MNKGKKKMNKNKETKLKVKGPEVIEDGLMDMGRGICGARKNWVTVE